MDTDPVIGVSKSAKVDNGCGGSRLYEQRPEGTMPYARRRATVHEMARDEARHGRALKGLLERYFK